VATKIENGIKENIKDFLRPLVNRIPNKIRYGEKYRRFYKEIDIFFNLSLEKKREVQLEKIREIVKYAYTNVPYYKKLFDKNNISYNIKTFDDFEKIPFLTKEIIKNNLETLCSGEKIKKKKYTTGGTTGMPMEFYLDDEVQLQENCFIDFYWKKFSSDYRNNKKIIVIRGNIPKNNKLFEKIGNKLIISSFKLNKDTIDIYLMEILKFDPDYIHIYPSSMNILAEYILKNEIKLNLKNLKGIFSSSETLYDSQRKNIENAFKVKICDLYGNSERVVIAFDNIKDMNYKLDLFYGYTELINEKGKNIILENGEKGEIVATGFWNKSMPLIRYKTGDIGVSKGEFETLKKILGRKSEYFIDKNENKVLFTCADEIFWDFKNEIEAYQYIQNEKGKVLLNIELGNKEQILTNDKIKKLKEEFNRLYENIEIDIKIVEKIERTKRGKFKYLVQNINYEIFKK